MSQGDIVHDLGTMYVRAESSFATGGSSVRMWPVQGTWKVEREQEQLAIENLKVRVNDTTPPVQGRKMPKFSFEHYVQPHLTVRDKATSLPTNDGFQITFGALMGGVSDKQGTLVDDVSATASLFSVDAGEGDRLPDGQLFAIDVSTTGFEFGGVKNRSTNAITPYPHLSAAPSDNAVIHGLTTYYLSQTNTQSLCFRVTSAQDADLQYEVKGATGSFEFSFTQGELAKVSFSFEGADYTGPEALAESVAHLADVLSDPLSVVGSKLILQPIATTTRVNVACDSYSIKVNNGMAHTETLTGGTNGKRSVLRMKDLEKAFAEIEIVMPEDRDFDAYYVSRSPLYCAFVLSNDHAEGRRFFVVETARCTLIAPPAYDRGSDKLTKMTLKLQAEYDQSRTAPHDNTDLATSPLRIGVG